MKNKISVYDKIEAGAYRYINDYSLLDESHSNKTNEERLSILNAERLNNFKMDLIKECGLENNPLADRAYEIADEMAWRSYSLTNIADNLFVISEVMEKE